MKKILIVIGFLIGFYSSFSQTFLTPRSSPSTTVQDSRLRALLNFYFPHTHGLTMNNGLDTLGMVIYEDSSSHVWYRDTVLGGGHKWSMLLKVGDAVSGVSSFNTRTGAVTLSSGDVVTALGFTPVNPNGTSFQYIAGDGSKVTFPTIPAQINITDAGLFTHSGTYPNYTFTGLTPAQQQVFTQGANLTQNNFWVTGANVLGMTGTAAFGLPTGSTSQRPSSPGTGYFRFNTDSSATETYNGSQWVKTGTGTGVTGVTSFNTRTGAVTLSSGDVTTALAFTPYNSSNPSGYISNIGGLVSAGANITITGSGAPGSPYVIVGTSSGSIFNQDSIKHHFVDTGATARNLYTIAWDSVNKKWILAAPGTGGGGTGTVTNFSFTAANGFTGNVTNPSTVPALTVGTSITGLLFGNGTAMAAATVSTPLTYSTGTLGIQVGGTSQNGYISSTDWNTFNGKINLTSLSATSPLLYNNTTGVFSIQVANTSQNGYLTSTDWNTFNGKQGALTLTTTGTSGAATLIGTTLNIPNYATGGGSQALTYTQNALNNNLAISGGNNINFLIATHSLAGLMDTASKAVADSLRNRTYTWPVFNIFAANGLTAAAGDSFYLGGALNQNTAIATSGFSLGITGLPSKATALSTDSVLIETIAGQIYKLPVPSGGGGSGTVTSFSAGTLSPLFTTSVATSTTTPALTFTLSTAAANTAFGNFTGSTATPTFGKLPLVAMATGAANNLIGYDGSGNPSAISQGSGISISSGSIGIANTTVTPGTYTNMTATVGADGRLVGAVSGTNLSTVWQPETFGAVPDGVTDCTVAFQRACDSAALTRGTVLLLKGTYLIRVSYRDTATFYTPSGIHVPSNITITGQGPSTIVKIAGPPAGATFSPISAPLTWSTNTKFFSLFNLDSVFNVTIQNLSVNGNLAIQINKAADLDPYDNPQQGTTTPNVETDGIYIRKGSNNQIYNIRIDSVTGYGTRNLLSPLNIISYSTITTCVNGGVYYGDLAGECRGSQLHHSLITNNNSDNVRLQASYVTIANNEISFAKRRPPGAGSINFAGIYLESDVGSGILGDVVTGNYIHDNSAFGIDQFQFDTVAYTYAGQSNLVYNNTINYNGAGGIQVQLPFTSIKNNNLLNNGRTSTGFIDSSGSQCHCGVQINGVVSIGVEIIGNSFKDTTKLMIGGALSGTPTPKMTFSANTAYGMSLTNNSAGVYYATAPYNSIYGNSYTDTAGNTHNDFATDQSGNFTINTNTGQNGSVTGAVTIGNGVSDAIIYGNHLASTKATYFGGRSPNGLEMATVIDERGWYGIGNSGQIGGRNWYVLDFPTNTRRLGVDSAGGFYVGSSGTITSGWSIRVRPPAISLSSTQNQVEVSATSSGSTSNAIQAGIFSTMNAGYTGTQGYMAAGWFDGKTASASNVLSGFGTLYGNFGVVSRALGITASGLNVGSVNTGYNGLRNVGVLGDATLLQTNSASALSIGVIGLALRANSSAIEVAGYFGLQATAPTFVSTALLVDNAAEAVPIQIWRDNGTEKARFADGGNLLIGTATDNAGFIQAAANTTTNASIFLNGATVDVTSPTNGMFWYNSTAHTLNFRDNGVTINLLSDVGVTTVGAFSGSSIANGASISTTTITFGPADGTNPGMVTTGAQTLAGDKTFSGSGVFNSISGVKLSTGTSTIQYSTVGQGILFAIKGATIQDITSSGGVAAVVMANRIGTPTFSATSAVSYNSVIANLEIDGAPQAGTNVTFGGKAYSIYVSTGDSYFGGNSFSSRFISSSVGAPPSNTAGSGAGTSPTILIVGTDQDGVITVTTGVTPSASSTILTVTYNGAYPNNSFPVLTPANAATALLSGASMVFTTGATTNFTITSGTTALLPATAYQWFYHIGAN